jgi:hypothetical protein
VGYVELVLVIMKVGENPCAMFGTVGLGRCSIGARLRILPLQVYEIYIRGGFSKYNLAILMSHGNKSAMSNDVYICGYRCSITSNMLRNKREFFV